MDAELAALASSAATALIAAMTEDGWARIKQDVAALWRRVRPERVGQVASELDETHAELTAARQQGNADVEGELVTEWRGRLRRLLAADAHVAGELRTVLGLEQISAGGLRFGAVVHHGSGDVNQAGRDMTVHQGPRNVPGHGAEAAPDRRDRTIEDGPGPSSGRGPAHG